METSSMMLKWEQFLGHGGDGNKPKITWMEGTQRVGDCRKKNMIGDSERERNGERENNEKKKAWEDLSALVGFDFNGSQR